MGKATGQRDRHRDDQWSMRQEGDEHQSNDASDSRCLLQASKTTPLAHPGSIVLLQVYSRRVLSFPSLMYSSILRRSAE